MSSEVGVPLTSEAYRRSRIWPWLAIVGFLLVVVMNYLAVNLPLAGRTTGEISDRFPVSLTPAGYAFSIWGLIYLALAGFVVYQYLPAQASKGLDRLRILFVLSCLFNVGWLLAWHYLFVPLSLLLMLGLLAALALIYRQLLTPGTPVGVAATWLVHVPFSLYLGWISVATLVNVAVVLYDLGPLRIDALDLSWTVISLVLLTALTLWIVFRWGDAAFTLVAVWAIVGILVANIGQPVIGVAAGGAALLLAAAVVRTLLRNSRSTAS